METTTTKKLYRTNKEILGAFAKWITRQSPYIEDISGILLDIRGKLEERPNQWHDVQDFQDDKDLLDWVGFTCKLIPSVSALNISRAAKRGEHQPDIVLVSRYDVPDREHDFVDLDALIRNVANELQRD